MAEKFGSPEINEQSEETLVLPEGTYFIHGIKPWSKTDSIGLRSPEVCASLQKDNITSPLRPYGYILKLDKGAISGAFDRDVASEYNERYEKQFKPQSVGHERRKYDEEELQELIKNTRSGSHNEVWVRGDGVEIIGAYITEEALSAPGAKAFLKTCQENNIPVRIIRKELEINL